ncbi:hypothetical protein [Pontibacter sp. G13]|uniref:hypothetical protein n=1 Tax=Pontibacter sp. G13 TaxID=3074898 RepID=UPI00288B6427|nr:hypothetical protein [Pontibacter sp. G13]WNJ18886.1 hypothetical protein RJD25_00220 [Pontibacter sp. G13]
MYFNAFLPTRIVWAVWMLAPCIAFGQMTSDTLAIPDWPSEAPTGHSYRDFKQDQPLTGGLALGYKSFGIDLWMEGSAVWIGANKGQAKSHKFSLRKMYLDPLSSLITNQPEFASQKFQLILTINNEPLKALMALNQLLTPYAWMLSGPGQPDNPVKIIIHIPGDQMAIDWTRFPLMSRTGSISDLPSRIPSEEMPVIAVNFFDMTYWSGRGQMPAEEFEIFSRLAAQAEKQQKQLLVLEAHDRPEVWSAMKRAGVQIVSTKKAERFKLWLLEHP